MTLPAHSRVGASGMSRWELNHCPGSVRLSAGLESKAGFAAAEGTVAHGLAEMALNGEDYRGQLGTVIVQDGFEIVVSKAMIDHVTEYKVILDDLTPKGATCHVEHRFHLEALHPALFGTSDAVVWNPATQHLDICDFKYGAGHAVEVEDNVQLMYYAVGAVQTLGYPAKTIGLHIVQPRCPHADGPHRTVTIDAVDLIEFAAYMVASVRATEKPDAPVRAGDWCRYCPASGVPGKCPVQEKVVNEMAKVAFAPALPYEPEALAKALDQIPVLEARIKALREFAYNEAEAGRTPPRYKLVEKQAREKWSPDATADKIRKAFSLTDADVFEEPSLKSPAQLRKLVPGKNDRERAAALATFTVKESSGHTLVSVDDKRAPVAISAQAAFLSAE